MIGDLPKPIALCIMAENSGDTEAMTECFTENAVVRDENQTIEGLTAIKKWKSDQPLLRIECALALLKPCVLEKLECGKEQRQSRIRSSSVAPCQSSVTT
ncbi:MAG: nuclear transport factor 2 family protein [Chthoniobacterales bacterium]